MTSAQIQDEGGLRTQQICQKWFWGYKGVLILAGVELNVFFVASMGLCFGFMLETVLIIQGCFCYR